MSKVVVYMSMSLDGFVAGPDDGPGRGLGTGGEVLHGWLSDGDVDPGSHRPTSGVDAEVFDEFLATGAVITGRHTFEWAGEWGGDHHDGVPIYVLTRTDPADADRGVVHYTSDLRWAVQQATEAAGERDVMVHGASSVQALHEAGLVDEYALTLVPVLLGGGTRLFAERPGSTGLLELIGTREGRGVLHLRYRVVR